MQAKWMTVLVLGAALCLSASVMSANDDGKVPAVQPPASNTATTDGAALKPPAGTPMADNEIAARREHMQQEIETKLNNPPPSLLEKFDADHDGKLNDAEKATARAELTARAEQYLAEMKAGNVPGVGPGGVKSHAEMMAAYAAKLDNPTPEILQRFDTDHDGKLSPEEKATALKQIEEHMQKNAAMNAGGGGPGNGQASMTPEQQRAYIMARLDNPSPELLKRFDQDGDGKLSPEEKAAAVTQIMKQREKKADKAAPAGTAP